MEVVIKIVCEGALVFHTWFWGVETLAGAGAAAVFIGLIREVGPFPPPGGGAALEFWVVPGFLPLNGAGGLWTELGLEVVVLLEGGSAVFGVEALGLVGGALASGFPLDREPGLLPAAAALLVAVLFAVVVPVAAAVVLGAGTSSSSGLTTTKDVTGVTKL